MAECGGVAVFVEFGERFGHPLQAKDLKLVERWMCQQVLSPPQW